MSRLLRYLQTRVASTKDGRHVRSGDVTFRKYSTFLQLSSIGAGPALCVGSLLAVGLVAKDLTGTPVFLSVLIAVLLHIVCIQCHAELRSHFPRLQAPLYEYVFHTVGELVAFVVAWSDILVSVLYSGAAWRVISAHVDLMSGQVVSNATTSFTGPHALFVLDPLACLLAVIAALYIALGGSTGPQLLFYHITNAVMCVTLMFTFTLGAFHINPDLWQVKYVFQVPYIQILRGTAVLLPMMLSQRSLLVSCDFMWLGIKPTVLRSLVFSGVVVFVGQMCMASLLPLLSPPQSWTSDATVTVAFEVVGMRWVKYALGPVVGLLLAAYGLVFMLGALESLRALCKDGLVPHCQRAQNRCRDGPMAALVGSLSAVLALLLPPALLLQAASVLVLLETLGVASLTLVLRYRPPQHIATVCDNNTRSQPETTSLIEGPDALTVSQELTYGALPVASPPTYQMSEDDDDIDRVVEEYRLEHATRCHHGIVHTTPTLASYRWARVASLLFTVSVLVCALVVQHGLESLRTKRPLQVALVVLSALTACLSVLVLIVKPTDRILPRTFLLRLLTVPTIPLVTMATLTWLLSTIAMTEALLATGWLVLGIMVYIVQILCQRDAHYKELQLSPTSPPLESTSGSSLLHTHPPPDCQTQAALEIQDSQLLATFVTCSSKSSEEEDDSLILDDDGYHDNRDREMLVQ